MLRLSQKPFTRIINHNYKVFVNHFEDMAKLGLPFGTSDLVEMAVRLWLPIPDPAEFTRPVTKKLMKRHLVYAFFEFIVLSMRHENWKLTGLRWYVASRAREFC